MLLFSVWWCDTKDLNDEFHGMMGTEKFISPILDLYCEIYIAGIS